MSIPWYGSIWPVETLYKVWNSNSLLISKVRPFLLIQCMYSGGWGGSALVSIHKECTRGHCFRYVICMVLEISLEQNILINSSGPYLRLNNIMNDLLKFIATRIYCNVKEYGYEQLTRQIQYEPDNKVLTWHMSFNHTYMYYIPVHYIPVHYIPVHYIPVHYIPVHYIPVQQNAPIHLTIVHMYTSIPIFILFYIF